MLHFVHTAEMSAIISLICKPSIVANMFAFAYYTLIAISLLCLRGAMQYVYRFSHAMLFPFLCANLMKSFDIHWKIMYQ